MTAGPARVMQCMEVWGGNQRVDNGVVMPGLDARVYSLPYAHGAGEVSAGGDVYYLSSCATGRIVRVLVADVAGHGESVAGVAAGLRGLMRRYVNYVDQSAFVRELNEQFGASETGGRFATAVAGTYFGPTGYLTLTNAGHPRPLLYRARRGEWAWLAHGERREESRGEGGPANIPLGITDATYDELGVRLSRGDLVLLYSDSLLEARAPGGAMLGEKGLLGLVRALDAGRPGELVASLLEAVSEFMRGAAFEDDVTVLLLSPNGMSPRRGLGEQLGALAGFVGSLTRRLAGGKEPVPWPELSVTNLLGPVWPWANRLWGGRAQEGEIERR